MRTNQPLRNSFALWFGMVGAPFIWVAHFMIMWAITEMGCRLGVADARIFGIYAAHLFSVLSTVIALTLIAASGLIAYRRWQQIRAAPPAEPADSGNSIGRTQFMNTLGMLFSILFAVTVIYMLIPVFVLPLCDIVR